MTRVAERNRQGFDPRPVRAVEIALITEKRMIIETIRFQPWRHERLTSDRPPNQGSDGFQCSLLFGDFFAGAEFTNSTPFSSPG